MTRQHASVILLPHSVLGVKSILRNVKRKRPSAGAGIYTERTEERTTIQPAADTRQAYPASK